MELVGDDDMDIMVALDGEKHGAQDPCTVVLIVYVDSDDAYDNNGSFNHKVEDYSDPDRDEVPNDINEKGTNEDRNVNKYLVGNLNRGIMIRNDLRAHMLIIDLNVVHTSEFLEYSNILRAHQLATDSEREELLVGQKFVTNEKSVFSIKWYIMNMPLDYKFIVSKLTYWEVFEVDRRLQLRGTSHIYPKVTNVGD
ncbi:hypothetical protein J1N35_041457 [Gossypium stocksii]|uniref:Uncharacterized protein n=1 Tax=Gossypium stocksii TaxID=47602 RepID=A0A9D3UFZ7_9ROSI|nr:hypothetical protein J1N35_041457 [Gossypium stocksii]